MHRTCMTVEHSANLPLFFLLVTISRIIQAHIPMAFLEKRRKRNGDVVSCSADDRAIINGIGSIPLAISSVRASRE